MKQKLFAAGAMSLIAAAAVVACGGSSTNAVAPVQAPFTAKIIGFNDFHGNLESPGTFGENTAVAAASRPAVGGAAAMAGYVAALKRQNPLNVVVGAGDFIGATPLISSLFFDEPAIEALNRIGMEFNAVGNHEFDQGSAELVRLQNGGCKIVNGQVSPNSCKGATVGTPVPFEGAKFKWLSANVVSTATNKTLLQPYGIKEFNGVKVAFIGMTFEATPGVVTPTGVAGLQFRNEVATVNALVPELRAQGIESIVVLVHQGGFQTGTLSDINGCEGNLAGSEIAKMVAGFDDAIDAVISGHTHAAYNCMLPSAKGRTIPVTSSSAFGRLVTEIDITIDPATRDITKAVAKNTLTANNNAAVPADGALASIIAKYKELVSPLANTVIGAVTSQLTSNRVDGACNMPAGSLIADSQLAATQPAALGGAVIAFMNGGGVRSPGFDFISSAVGEGNGNITYGEAFTVQPFGNSLTTITMNTQLIRDFLEEQFAGCLGQPAATTRFALPSAGFKYTWDGANACGARITNATLRTAAGTEALVINGVVQNPTKTYRVTVNNFMADGGDGFSTLTRGTNRIGGAQDIDALSAFLAGFKAPNPYNLSAVTLDGGTPRINRVGTSTVCPGGTSTNP
jgi:5'-nucleotidase